MTSHTRSASTQRHMWHQRDTQRFPHGPGDVSMIAECTCCLVLSCLVRLPHTSLLAVAQLRDFVDNLFQSPLHLGLGWETVCAHPTVACSFGHQRAFYEAQGTCHPLRPAGSACTSSVQCAPPHRCLGGYCCAASVGEGCAACGPSSNPLANTRGRGNCKSCANASRSLYMLTAGTCRLAPTELDVGLQGTSPGVVHARVLVRAAFRHVH